jgi:hypothetical protein
MYETRLTLADAQQGLFRTSEGDLLPVAFLHRGELFLTDDGTYILRFWREGFVRQLYYLDDTAAEWIVNRCSFAGGLTYNGNDIPVQPDYEGMLLPYPEMEV